jgi:hypothetical protein
VPKPPTGCQRRHEEGLWVTKNGYATNLGRTESQQAIDLSSTIDAVHRLSGMLGVTDYRYFNVRSFAAWRDGTIERPLEPATCPDSSIVFSRGSEIEPVCM